MLCPNCGKLISINAEKCIHCGMKNPGAWQSVPFFKQVLGGQLSYVRAIIAACVALYLLAILLGPREAIMRSSGIFNILPAPGKYLFLLGSTGSAVVATGRWWTVVTAIYLHGNLLHILFNMLWIRQLGPEVESLFGPSRFFLIFTISGVFGFLVSNFIGIPFTVGASGSVFGLLGAMVHYGRHRGGTFGAQIYSQTMMWAVFLFILGFTMSAVNNWAHAGGFIGGFVTAMLVGYSEQSRESLWHRRLALLALVATIAAFLVAFYSLLLYLFGGGTRYF